MKQAIIFDLDDTLYDARGFYSGAFQEIAQYLALKYKRDAVALHGSMMDLWERGTSRNRMLATCFLGDMGLPVDEADALLTLLHGHETELELYPDAEELIKSARESGILLGIVTDGHGQMERSKIRGLDLVSRVDAIVFTHDGGDSWRKPSPLPFKSICSQLGVAPQDAVYVGDDPHVDAGGPRRLGMEVLRIRRGRFSDVAATGANFDGEIQLLSDLFHSEVTGAAG